MSSTTEASGHPEKAHDVLNKSRSPQMYLEGGVRVERHGGQAVKRMTPSISSGP